MSTLDAVGTDGGSERRTRLAYGGLWIVSGVCLGLLAGVGRPLVGVGLYVAAVLGAIAVRYRYPRPLFDERDAEVHRIASAQTLALFGVASAVVFPALTALHGLGHFEWGRSTTTAALLVAALYVTYGAAIVRVGRRR